LAPFPLLCSLTAASLFPFATAGVASGVGMVCSSGDSNARSLLQHVKRSIKAAEGGVDACDRLVRQVAGVGRLQVVELERQDTGHLHPVPMKPLTIARQNVDFALRRVCVFVRGITGARNLNAELRVSGSDQRSGTRTTDAGRRNDLTIGAADRRD
jgi:hypothetical protein